MRHNWTRAVMFGLALAAIATVTAVLSSEPASAGPSATVVSNASLFVDDSFARSDGSPLSALGFLDVQTTFKPGRGRLLVGVSVDRAFVVYDPNGISSDFQSRLQELNGRADALKAELRTLQARIMELQALLEENPDDSEASAEIRRLAARMKEVQGELVAIVQEIKQILREIEQANPESEEERYELKGVGHTDEVLTGTTTELDVTFTLQEKRGQRSALTASLELEFSPAGEFRSGELTTLCLPATFCDSFDFCGCE